MSKILTKDKNKKGSIQTFKKECCGCVVGRFTFICIGWVACWLQ